MAHVAQIVSIILCCHACNWFHVLLCISKACRLANLSTELEGDGKDEKSGAPENGFSIERLYLLICLGTVEVG